MVCFQTSKTWVLGVQLSCLRVLNLWYDESNLVFFLGLNKFFAPINIVNFDFSP